MSGFTIQIDNARGDDTQLYLLLTAASSSDVTGITPGTAVQLSEFKNNNPTMTINIGSIDSARLYVGYGNMHAAPLPDGGQYFGWIEFTKHDSDKNVWINLSNVDIIGLPLTLAGVADNGTPFTLGYATSINAIVDDMKRTALIESTAAAVITCTTGQTKIVGPNIMPTSYHAYEPYLQTLMDGRATLIITSDRPSSGSAKIFTGSFLNAASATDPIINLIDEDGIAFTILKQEFTSNIIYKCDGGTLLYGGKTYPQNRTPDNDKNSAPDARTITNSVFRNILIGINEGYFTADSDNRSANFPYLAPFATGQGSAYANVVHTASNSYGFPYADSNLKVLITADPTKPITMTIIKDDVAAGYDGTPPDDGNKPLSGDYQFGIGGGSSALGVITIGNCRYLPNSDGGYGGFLPSVDEWIQMAFEDGKHQIWIKTSGAGSNNGNECFTNPPFWKDKTLTWGAHTSWNKDAPSSEKPPT